MRDNSTPLARLYVDSPLADEASVMLGVKQAHYVLHVMRAKVGDRLWLFNGRDGEWVAKITETGRKSVCLQLTYESRPQHEESGPWLCFAPIKFGRIDNLVEKAVELGASLLRPVQTTRTIVRRINGERLQAHAIEAAEQSERLTVPEVRPMQALGNMLRDWPKGRVLYYGDETGRGMTVQHAFASAKGDVAMLVGPEGGFAPEELSQLRAHPSAVGVSLGPRILRADTAALAMLACYQAMAGGWDNAPSFRGAPPHHLPGKDQ